MSRSLALAERRRVLIERSRLAREEMRAALTGLVPGLDVADRLVSVAGWTSRHRLLVAGVAAAALAWSRSRRLFGFASRAWALWRALQTLSGKLSSLASRGNGP